MEDNTFKFENNDLVMRYTDVPVYFNIDNSVDSVDIKVLYHDDDLIRFEKNPKGDWIDMRAAEDVSMKAGEFRLISLGVSVKLPEGYEMVIFSRSSTFENFGVIQVNHLGIIDNAYSSDLDIIKFPAYAVRDTVIHKNDRICQFRIQQSQPTINFIEVDHLDGEPRGGFGSTGVK